MINLLFHEYDATDSVKSGCAIKTKLKIFTVDNEDLENFLTEKNRKYIKREFKFFDVVNSSMEKICQL